jgi:hypothetical protein
LNAADLRREFQYQWEAARYALSGDSSGGLPHIRKRHVIREFAHLYHLDVFVETGTYMGDMLAAMLPHFRTLHSIELSPGLHERARKRFAGCPQCHLVQGDSGEALASIVSTLQVPALFWLDAHFSGGVTARGGIDPPVGNELTAILAHPIRQHVVLIDDARLFDGRDGYPAIVGLRDVITAEAPWYAFQVEQDIIQLVPRG